MRGPPQSTGFTISFGELYKHICTYQDTVNLLNLYAGAAPDGRATSATTAAAPLPPAYPVEHTLSVSVAGISGLPDTAQLLGLGLPAPRERYLRYQFPGGPTPHVEKSNSSSPTLKSKLI